MDYNTSMAQKDSTEVLFREVQRFRQLWLWIILLSITAVCIYAVVEQLIRGNP